MSSFPITSPIRGGFAVLALVVVFIAGASAAVGAQEPVVPSRPTAAAEPTPEVASTAGASRSGRATASIPKTDDGFLDGIPVAVGTIGAFLGAWIAMVGTVKVALAGVVLASAVMAMWLRSKTVGEEPPITADHRRRRRASRARSVPGQQQAPASGTRAA